MMNYPNYAGYMPQYPQPMNLPQTAPRDNAGINWVTGQEGAKSWAVARGESVLLMDSENQVFYIKSTDQTGMPMPLRIFDYKERVTEQTSNPSFAPHEDGFVTREEYEELKQAIEELKKEKKHE